MLQNLIAFHAKKTMNQSTSCHFQEENEKIKKNDLKQHVSPTLPLIFPVMPMPFSIVV